MPGFFADRAVALSGEPPRRDSPGPVAICTRVMAARSSYWLSGSGHAHRARGCSCSTDHTRSRRPTSSKVLTDVRKDQATAAGRVATETPGSSERRPPSGTASGPPTRTSPVRSSRGAAGQSPSARGVGAERVPNRSSIILFFARDSNQVHGENSTRPVPPQSNSASTRLGKWPSALAILVCYGGTNPAIDSPAIRLRSGQPRLTGRMRR